MILNKLFHFLQVDKIVVIAIGIMICVSFTGCIEKEKEIKAVISVKESGFIHERIEFDGSKSFTIRGMEIKKWEWEFGDDETAEGEIVTHIYKEGGTYTVKLSVTDSDNATDETMKEIWIRPGNPPRAVIDCPSGVLPANESIKFDGSNSSDNGYIKSYEWEFGDGTNGSGKKTTHEYSEEGNYTIVLTVVDDNNITDETEVEIEIRRGIKYFEVDSCWHIPDFIPSIGGTTIFYESEMILPPICSFCIGIGNELEAGTTEKYSAWDIKSEEGLENYLYLDIEEWGVTIPDPERGYKWEYRDIKGGGKAYFADVPTFHSLMGSIFREIHGKFKLLEGSPFIPISANVTWKSWRS